MLEKEVKDIYLRKACAKIAVYYYCDGYFPDENGVEKKREISQVLSAEEMMAIQPYIQPYMESIKETVTNIKLNNIPNSSKSR